MWEFQPHRERIADAQCTVQHVFTLPMGVVAKYCDEYVCLWVCLSVCEDISGTTRAIFT